MDKFIKSSLPITSEFLRQKRVLQERGELALIEDGQTFHHLTYFTLTPGEGFFRGGHYHIRKTECFYIISGKLLVTLIDIESSERIELDLLGGNTLRIMPMCAHQFSALEHAQVIEYYENKYDPNDDFRVSSNTGF